MTALYTHYSAARLKGLVRPDCWEGASAEKARSAARPSRNLAGVLRCELRREGAALAPEPMSAATEPMDAPKLALSAAGAPAGAPAGAAFAPSLRRVGGVGVSESKRLVTFWSRMSFLVVFLKVVAELRASCSTESTKASMVIAPNSRTFALERSTAWL